MKNFMLPGREILRLLISFTFILLFFFRLEGKQIDLKEIEKEEYNYGHYITSSGEKVDAELYYDAATNILFERIKRKEVLPHHANTISYFEVSSGQRVRKFYSLPYDHDKTGYLRDTFFEVLFEGEDLAVLNYYFIINKGSETTSFSGANGTNYYAQTENRQVIDKIYLVNSSLGIQEYLSKRTGLIKEYKIVKKSLTENFFGDSYEKVRNYMIQNNLHLNDPTQLVEAVSFYLQIR